MKTEDKNKEVVIDEVAMSVRVNPIVIERVRSGEVTYITLQIDEDNQNDLLENVCGHGLQESCGTRGSAFCLS